MIRIPMNLSGCHKRSAKGSTLPLKTPGVFLGRSPQIDKFPFSADLLQQQMDPLDLTLGAQFSYLPPSENEGMSPIKRYHFKGKVHLSNFQPLIFRGYLSFFSGSKHVDHERLFTVCSFFHRNPNS